MCVRVVLLKKMHSVGTVVGTVDGTVVGIVAATVVGAGVDTAGTGDDSARHAKEGSTSKQHVSREVVWLSDPLRSESQISPRRGSVSLRWDVQSCSDQDECQGNRA